MGFRGIVYFAFVALCIAVSGCGADGAKRSDEKKESSFVAVESDGTEEASTFKDADVLEIDLMERDDSDEDWIRGSMKVTNTSKSDAHSIQMKILYKDADGNIVDESHSQSYFGVPAGKSAYLPFDLLLMDGQTHEQVKTIEVASYDYATDDFIYEVDVAEKHMESHARHAGSKKAFKKQNLLTFDYKELGTESDGQHVIEIKAVNNGEAPLIQVEATIALFDADGNVLGTGFTGAVEPVAPGGNTIMITRAEIPSGSEVASYGVFAYTTKTTRPDGNGFNYYKINLIEETAEGLTID